MSNLAVDRTDFTESNRFLVWFALGAVAMVLVKALFGQNQLVITAIPVTLMLFYFFQLKAGHLEADRPERAGDNIYYLGFLFTLVSLSLALYSFSQNADDKSSLIGDFAIALSTTIAGVLGRVWLGQGSREIDDHEQKTKRRIAEITEQYREDLERSREIMVDFSSATMQMLEESREQHHAQIELDRENLEDHFEVALTTMSDALSNAALTSASRIKSDLETFASETSLVEQKFTSNVSELNEKIEHLAGTLGNTLAGLESLPDLSSVVEEKMEAAIRPITASMESIGLLADKQQTWVEGQELVVTQIGTTVDKLSSELDTLSLIVRKSVEALGAPTNDIKKAYEGIQQQVSSISSSTSNFEKAAQEVMQLPESINGVVQSVASSVAQLNREISSLESTLAATRKQATTSLETEKENMQEIVSERKDLLQSLKSSNQGIAGNVETLESQLKLMSDSLIEVAKFIRSKTS